VISNASLTLPPDLFPSDQTPITFRGSLAISPQFQITGQLTVSNIHLAYAGFALSVQTITLDNNGINADGVSLSIPDLGPNGGPLVLTGALSITTDPTDPTTHKLVIDGHIDIPDISLSAYGFTLSAHNISLGNQGLSVGSATLDLSGLGLGDQTLSVSDLRITPSFNITGGTISVDGSSTLSLSYFDSTLTVSDLSFVSGGISAASVSLALPNILGGKTLTLDGLTIGFDGRVSGQLVSTANNPLSIGLSDFNVGADSIAFDSKGGITVTNAMLNLPIFQGGLSVGDISYDGHSLQFSNLPALPTDFTIPGLVTGQSVASIKADCKAGGGAFLPLPPINAGGFSVSGCGCLNFGKDANGHTTYDIIGRGSVSLAKIGSLNALVEIGSIDDDHPSNLRHAALDVQIAGAGIPIDETGLEINGINGEIYITGYHGAPIYTFQVGLDFQTDDGGFVFKGAAHATFSSDGNFGSGGSGTFFTLLPIAGGFCVRLVAQHDYVCQNSLTHHGAEVDTSNGTGL